MGRGEVGSVGPSNEGGPATVSRAETPGAHLWPGFWAIGRH